MTHLTTTNNQVAKLNEEELLGVLQSSLYPGANPASIKLVLSYCQAAGLDPMQKPVHIVPMWDSKSRQMRDVVMPGIGLYRTQAARSGEYAGVTDPEFGPDVTELVGGLEMTYPAWCRVTVKRLLPSGAIAEFSATERWKENYATAGKDSSAPNAMWRRRPYGQIGKCAEAQALRKAFPEFGAQPTADEMEGKSFNGEVEIVHDEPTRIDVESLIVAAQKTTNDTDLMAFWAEHNPTLRAQPQCHARLKAAVTAKRQALKRVLEEKTIDMEQADPIDERAAA